VATPTQTPKFDVERFTQRRKARPQLRKKVKGLKKPALQKRRKKLTTQVKAPDATPEARQELRVVENRLGRMALREKHGSDWREKVLGEKKAPHYGQQLAKLIKGGLEESEQTKLTDILSKRTKRRKKLRAAMPGRISKPYKPPKKPKKPPPMG